MTEPRRSTHRGNDLHVYREGYDALLDFCRYCSIEQPTIQGTLP